MGIWGNTNFSSLLTCAKNVKGRRSLAFVIPYLLNYDGKMENTSVPDTKGTSEDAAEEMLVFQSSHDCFMDRQYLKTKRKLNNITSIMIHFNLLSHLRTPAPNTSAFSQMNRLELLA
jgi:hypothetical protein